MVWPKFVPFLCCAGRASFYRYPGSVNMQCCRWVHKIHAKLSVGGRWTHLIHHKFTPKITLTIPTGWPTHNRSWVYARPTNSCATGGFRKKILQMIYERKQTVYACCYVGSVPSETTRTHTGDSDHETLQFFQQIMLSKWTYFNNRSWNSFENLSQTRSCEDTNRCKFVKSKIIGKALISQKRVSQTVWIFFVLIKT